MKTIIQSYKKLLRQMAVLFLGATLLTGCGDISEKADLLKIATVLYDTGMNQKTQEEYQAKLKNIKSEEEAKQIIGDMVALMEKTPAQLEKLDLQTPAAKSVRDKLARGLRGVVESTQEMTKLNLATDGEKIIALQSKLLQAQQDLQAAQEEYIELAKRHGVDLEKMKK